LEKTKKRDIEIGSDEFLVSVNGRSYTVALMDDDKIRIGQNISAYNTAETKSGLHSLILNGQVYQISFLDSPSNGSDRALFVNVNNQTFEVIVDDHRSLIMKNLLRGRSDSPVAQAIKAPMPGRIVRLEVKSGDEVKAGSGLLVLEAMKMENEIKATWGGVVEQILVDAGRAVEKGQTLLTIKPV
jgi:biotin carboxyl carrier protein